MSMKEGHATDADRLDALRRKLEGCPTFERRQLRAWLRRIDKRRRSGQAIDRSLQKVELALAEAEATRKERAEAANRALHYPSELPVSERREEIADAIANNQVVVVCGETGSGKTTQLPKICLELGRGVDGRIGHTQPRRIAARSVAERIAEEVGTDLGSMVGWQVRFTKETSTRTAIKVMTDGILLAETQDDPELLRYDTIIIDEAHERSLNIDFLLGYLRRLLPKRPDLKVIVTSATIDAERFSNHFGDCPVIEVSGRTWPVEVRWRPVEAEEADEEDPSLLEGIQRAIEEIVAAEEEGDILVFLSGEREIREASQYLGGIFGDRLELLPLYARLPAKDQKRVFQVSTERRVILATNVAETSITVPGIRAVIDSGLARIARYSARARVERLPIEQISQASATQRSGRCGRVGPGICIRLYSEETFNASEPFTQPEILRSNLASVILRMLALGLGDIDSFPFLERPPGRMVEEGWATLYELGAVERSHGLTEVGQRLARLPVDPRIGRMLVASVEEHCLGEILVLAAVLSIQDPRLRPFGGEQAADFAHSPWRNEKSDFVGLLKLWHDYRSELSAQGSSATRRWCRERYLSWIRMREWTDVRNQLRELVKEVLGIRATEPEGPGPREGGWGALHRSVLAGMVSHVGRRTEDHEYATSSGGAFAVHPSSGLFRSDPPWIVAAELVETTRRYGRLCAKIRGEWIERVAPHLVRREYADPHFLVDSGQVAAWERVHYGNLVVVAHRRVPFGPIDRETARDVFIHEALVEENLRTKARFLERNAQLRQRIERLEEKGRRRDLLVGTDARFAFYDARIPAEVHSAPSFERWRSKAERANAAVLLMQESDLLRPRSHDIDRDAFPDALEPGGARLPLRYRHEPGTDDDGVSLEVPLAGLNLLDVGKLEWLVPGMLAEKIEALLRALPKRIRTRFSPMKETAEGAVEGLEFGAGDLCSALATYLTNLGGVDVLPTDFDQARVGEHLSIRLIVLDETGREVASSRDVEELRSQLSEDARAAFAERVRTGAAGIESSGQFDLGNKELVRTFELPGAGGTLTAYPAFVDEGKSIAVRLFDSEEEAVRQHRGGVLRALGLMASDALMGLLDWLMDGRGLELAYAPLGNKELLRSEIESLVLDAAFLSELSSVDAIRSQAALERVYERGFPELSKRTERIVETLEAALGKRNQLLVQLDQSTPTGWADVVDDIKQEVEGVVPSRFARAGWARIREAPRRLDALASRLRRLHEKGPQRDVRDRATLAPWVEGLQAARHCVGETPELLAYEQAVDELRIHLAAPSLAGPGASSPRRLRSAWEKVRKLAPHKLRALD